MAPIGMVAFIVSSRRTRKKAALGHQPAFHAVICTFSTGMDGWQTYRKLSFWMVMVSEIVRGALPRDEYVREVFLVLRSSAREVCAHVALVVVKIRPPSQKFSVSR